MLKGKGKTEGLKLIFISFYLHLPSNELFLRVLFTICQQVLVQINSFRHTIC